MNFDKLEHAIISYRESLARFRDDREALRALGVTDLPGDAPTVAPKPAPGNLPGEPTEEMLDAALEMQIRLHQNGERGSIKAILRAALAAAPRVEAEIPEVTEEDAQALCRASWGWAEDRHVSIPDTQATLVGLRAVRARLIARMGAKP